MRRRVDVDGCGLYGQLRDSQLCASFSYVFLRLLVRSVSLRRFDFKAHLAMLSVVSVMAVARMGVVLRLVAFGRVVYLRCVQWCVSPRWVSTGAWQCVCGEQQVPTVSFVFLMRMSLRVLYIAFMRYLIVKMRVLLKRKARLYSGLAKIRTRRRSRRRWNSAVTGSLLCFIAAAASFCLRLRLVTAVLVFVRPHIWWNGQSACQNAAVSCMCGIVECRSIFSVVALMETLRRIQPQSVACSCSTEPICVASRILWICSLWGCARECRSWFC